MRMSEDEVEDHFEFFKKEIKKLKEHVHLLKKENLEHRHKFYSSRRTKALLECIEFYADKKNWFVGRFSEFTKIDAIIREDQEAITVGGRDRVVGGKLARETLVKNKEIENETL